MQFEGFWHSGAAGGAWVLQEHPNLQRLQSQAFQRLCNSQWLHQLFLLYLQFSLTFSLGYSPVGVAAADSKDI